MMSREYYSEKMTEMGEGLTMLKRYPKRCA